MISSGMDPVKKVRILVLHFKIVDLNASIQAFEALQAPTLYQKIQRFILEQKKARLRRKLRDLLAETG